MNGIRINVRCIIIQEGTIILCKNLKKGFYFLPGGGLEAGETINQCIARELKEEMGVSGNILVGENTEVIEHMFEDEKENFHEMNLLKEVLFEGWEKVQSLEPHISFEKIKLSDLETYHILPEKVKAYMIKKYLSRQ